MIMPPVCSISIFALVTWLLCGIAYGYSTGPPSSSCLSQQPYHVMRPPKSMTVISGMEASNFQINVSSTNWSVNESLTVTLMGASSRDEFVGFVLKAVRNGTRGTNAMLGPLLGSFTCPCISGGTCKNFSVYALNGENNCVSHSTNVSQQNVTCQWTAPATNEGPIMFLATVVVNYETYKTQVMSPVIDNAAGVPNLTLPEAQETITEPPTTAGCGTTKTCALYPSSCDVSGKCRSGVMMTKLPSGDLLFEMFGNTFDWLALGLGDTPQMQGQEVFACVYDSLQKKVVLNYGFAPAKIYMAVHRFNITMIKTMIEFGKGDTMSLPVQPNIIYCQFARPTNVNFTVYAYNSTLRQNRAISRSSNLTGSGKYVVLANGKNIPNTANLAMHGNMPLSSPIQFSASAAPRTMYFNGLKPLVQVHATLMTIFWMLLCGFAIIVARHTRPVLTQKLFSKQVWFLIHVVCMVIGYMVAVAGVIYVLIKLGEWRLEPQIHGIIGLIGMGLGLLNILAGIFRPHPDAKHRSIFNRIHRWNGLLSYVASGVAIWLGATLECHRPEFRFWSVIVLGIWTGLQLIFMIAFEVARLVVARNKKNELAIDKRFELSDQSASTQSVPGSEGNKSGMPLEKDEHPKVKGKQLVHITDPWIVIYAGTFVALAAAFWAGIWIH